MFSQMDLLLTFVCVCVCVFYGTIKQWSGVRRTISEQHPSVLEVADETMQVTISGRNMMRREEEEYNFTFHI